jgi:isopenicillin N synthase-like dioxygenase
MKIGTFDQFFIAGPTQNPQQLQPQHRIKLLKYPKTSPELEDGQGVGPHKDSSGWLTFLYQVGNEPGLEVLSQNGEWLSAPPVDGTFVVNFGNAFEAATEGAVKATVHRVKAPTRNDRYSIPFFMGLPLDLTVSHIRECFPREVTELRKRESQSAAETAISAFLDPRWDRLGESQLRKWIRSHEDVGRKWYGDVTVDYYLQ